MFARYASFAASFLLVLGAGAVLAFAVRSGAATTATATSATLPECSNGTVVANPSANAGLVADCSALLQAKDALRGSASLNWSSGLAIASWDGVTLTSAGDRVGRIDLGGKGLSGTLPATLGDLAGLGRLNLGGNRLHGSIPKELGNLSGLGHLNLANNRLIGGIPKELGNLSALGYLNLGGNQLNGNIPKELENLAGLFHS